MATPAQKFIGLGLLSTAILATAVVFGLHVGWPIALLVSVNIVTFLLYGFDKRQSRGKGIRVPENTLHLFCLVGGSPGAFVGQRVFHHKTRKGSFQLVFWVLVMVQLGLVGWLIWMTYRTS